MVATTSESLFTHFAVCWAKRAEGTAEKCVYPPYFTATSTAVVVWRCCAAAVMTAAVKLCCYCHSCGATVKHVARWEPYPAETIFTGTFLCSTESERKTNVVLYTGSLILSDNYLLQLPVGSFIVITSSLRKRSNTLRRRDRK